MRKKQQKFILQRGDTGSVHISEKCYYNYNYSFITPIQKSQLMNDILKSLKEGDRIEFRIIKATALNSRKITDKKPMTEL